jgi:hypothetical protein
MPLAVHTGFRAWGLNRGEPVLPRLGLALVGAALLQVALGVAALLAATPSWSGAAPALSVGARTAHQWFGAVLLGVAVALACWTFRLLRPHPPEPRAESRG